MHIYFDLDGTLVDEEGDFLRPGIRELLDALCMSGIMLSLWTRSTEERAMAVLDKFELAAYFTHVVAREHYDPNADGYGKDIRYLDGDLLVDDDPKNIEFVRSIGKEGYLVSFFSNDAPVDGVELQDLWRSISTLGGKNQYPVSSVGVGGLGSGRSRQD